jgi:hypothetical protein
MQAFRQLFLLNNNYFLEKKRRWKNPSPNHNYEDKRANPPTQSNKVRPRQHSGMPAYHACS